MNPDNMTNEELVRHIYNMPNASPLERLLAERLDESESERRDPV